MTLRKLVVARRETACLAAANLAALFVLLAFDWTRAPELVLGLDAFLWLFLMEQSHRDLRELRAGGRDMTRS